MNVGGLSIMLRLGGASVLSSSAREQLRCAGCGARVQWAVELSECPRGVSVEFESFIFAVEIR